MKFYSEITEKTYDTVEDLERAEAEKKAELDVLEEKRKERERREKEVDDAYERAYIARREADKLAESFTKDYGEEPGFDGFEKCDDCHCSEDCGECNCHNNCDVFEGCICCNEKKGCTGSIKMTTDELKLLMSLIE